MQRTSMATRFSKTLRNLRNTRDFRAELLNVAAELADSKSTTIVRIVNSAISIETVQSEWDRLMQAIKPDIAKRMQLQVDPAKTQKRQDGSPKSGEHGLIPLNRPNYRAEVLRLLIGASLAHDSKWSVKNTIEKIGASQTPVRNALGEFKRAGVLQTWGRDRRGSHADLIPENLSIELLAKVQALPQTLKFRFERGAQIRSPAELLQRALRLLAAESNSPWSQIALSGTTVAQAEVPNLDLSGTPRLDLVAFVPRDAKAFDANSLRKLNDGLEYEPNVLAPAPVMVTLVRADETEFRTDVIDSVRSAPQMDVFLSLLDMNLRRQAMQYAKAVRQ